MWVKFAIGCRATGETTTELAGLLHLSVGHTRVDGPPQHARGPHMS